MATESDAALRLDDVTVAYNGVPAVRGVSFEVGPGEVVGLIGPNGAGKTSVLSSVMGVVAPSGGSIAFAGQSIIGLSSEAVVRRGLALVPEGRHIFGNLTVQENLQLGLAGRKSRQGVAADMSNVLELFPILAEFKQRPAGLLSGGQQQQLAIGRALLSSPDLLMLDEPSLGLSPTAVDTVFDALTRIRESGTAVLMVEQRAQSTVEFADRTLVLHEGLITMSLAPSDAHDDVLLSKAYFG